MIFKATKKEVYNRGSPPDEFLQILVAWGKQANEQLFTPNDKLKDIYAYIRPILGNEHGLAWDSMLHRRAAMLEAMRVHAGFESSWKWKEGVDKSNKTSMANIAGQETGIFQVSYDSLYFGDLSLKAFAHQKQIDAPRLFIEKMKEDHQLALEYYARLSRVTMIWAGPVLRHEIDKYLSKDAVKEFEALLMA